MAGYGHALARLVAGDAVGADDGVSLAIPSSGVRPPVVGAAALGATSGVSDLPYAGGGKLATPNGFAFCCWLKVPILPSAWNFADVDWFQIAGGPTSLSFTVKTGVTPTSTTVTYSNPVPSCLLGGSIRFL
jgi:hypothetical protein